jgi:hypothetical protein
MPLQATSGAASYDAFGGGAAAVPIYIEDVFQTWLYTGNSSTQTITNGIDLSTKGGLVWTKTRSSANSHNLFDSTRALNQTLSSNTTQAQQTINNGNPLTFNTNGFSLPNSNDVNVSGTTYASWTFRKQPKFFDVVTYTGTGANRTIAHNLGSAPGCMFVKRTDTTGAWQVYHRNVGTTKYLVLNTTAAEANGATRWNSTAPTSTVFSLGTATEVNASGGTYVAYLFAHDAGGFGLTGTDNVISCGTYTGNGSINGPIVTLGWEPQFLLIKNESSVTSWFITDNMRGFTANSSGGDTVQLFPNTTGVEANNFYAQPSATGFQITDTSPDVNGSGENYIYIAIRRGPMKVPTSGTSVFATALGVSTTPNMVAGFPVDSFLGGDRDTPTSTNWKWWDRLRGNVASLLTTTTAAEATDEYNYGQFQSMTGFISGNYDASDKIGWMFKRAPSFFDEVCYKGTGSNRTITHNLAAVPELMLVKRRSAIDAWAVYFGDPTDYLRLNDPQAAVDEISRWNDTAPTSTVFTVGTDTEVNTSGVTYVNYLFASCPGVSKVGTYTGTATTKQIDCGFTGGARFVLIKRTDSTGDWYVWDSARGIVAGNDPYLLLNSTAAEVTNTDYVDTYSAGFEISSTAPAAINASGGTFIFLAIA